MSVPVDSSPDGQPDRDAKSAVLLAIRNALTLGGSLVFTWSIALVIRILIPRYLHTEGFGTINFADAFSVTAFLALNLGVDVYIRKEVAVRPAHASDFYGGIFALRILMTIGVFVVIHFVLAGRPAEIKNLVYIYSLAQFFVLANATLSAMLHSKGRVGGVSALAVATKVIWAAGVVWAMVTHAGLWAYGASYLASESVETVALSWLARRHLGLVIHVDVGKTKAMFVASLPYYLTALATTAYGKLDVSILEFRYGSTEVGLYGASTTIAMLTLLLTPLIGWVLTPMFARAAARSREELYQQVSGAMELILTVAMPASLVINLGADLWVRLFFGAEYAPAAPALRVLAVMFVLTYVAIIYAMTMTMLERQWAFTWISIAGLFVNVALNLTFVRFSVRVFGPGGGGTGCALAMLGTEIFVVTCMVVATRGGAVTRGNFLFVVRCLAAYAAAAVLHFVAAPLGYWRLPIDLALYLVLVIAMGALRPRQLFQAIQSAVRPPRGDARA